MKRTLIQNAVVVNEGRKVLGSVVIENEKIAEILVGGENATAPCDEIIDATGCYLLPGAIDEHVHFRDPGLRYHHRKSCCGSRRCHLYHGYAQYQSANYHIGGFGGKICSVG